MADFYANKKVLVTGGAGFIGSHVVEMLVKRGARVTVPVRATTKTDFLNDVINDISIQKADLRFRSEVDAVMKGQEIVLNIAAAKGGGIAHSMKHHGSLFRDNLEPFIQVLDSAREHQVERFLLTSTACVYPKDVTSPTPESEGFKDVPEMANAGYGWSKRAEEYMGMAYAEEFGMKIAIARPYNAYGPRDDFFAAYSHVIPALIKRIHAGENPLVVWGSGNQKRSFVYATDFARGLIDTCEKYAVADPVNIVSDEEITIGDLARLIAELMGKKIDIQFDTTRPDGSVRRNGEGRKAFEKMDFRCEVSLHEGLKKCIDWYKERI